MKFVHFQDPGTSYSTLTDERKLELRISSYLYITPNQPIIHCRKCQKSRNFKHFQLKNLKSSTPQDESTAHILKFEKFGQINAALYISDACMHWIHTCVTRNTHEIHTQFTQTMPPQLISRPPKKNFPRATAAAKI